MDRGVYKGKLTVVGHYPVYDSTKLPREPRTGTDRNDDTTNPQSGKASQLAVAMV
jgi:hypothetical protein